MIPQSVLEAAELKELLLWCTLTRATCKLIFFIVDDWEIPIARVSALPGVCLLCPQLRGGRGRPPGFAPPSIRYGPGARQIAIGLSGLPFGRHCGSWKVPATIGAAMNMRRYPAHTIRYCVSVLMRCFPLQLPTTNYHTARVCVHIWAWRIVSVWALTCDIYYWIT